MFTQGKPLFEAVIVEGADPVNCTADNLDGCKGDE
jgi:hypothetical protein